MGALNIASLVVLGILLTRRLILIDRFFVVRAVLITTFVCGLLLLLISLFMSGIEMHCANHYAPDVFFCPKS